MTVNEIMTELENLGDEKIKKVLQKHGVREPFFGVKVEYLKVIQKRIKKNYQLAKDLYATGNADAQYLAGLIADDEQMTTMDLQLWVKQALSKNICEYTVPWVAAGSKHGLDVALEWIESKNENIASAGWNTLSNVVSLKPNNDLPIDILRKLMGRVVETIHSADNRVRYTMNGYLIALGCYIPELTEGVLTAVNAIGTVMVDMGGTACKVPDPVTYINKVKERGSWGKKKKTVKC